MDVKPHNVKGHLTYSLRRLGLDYIDLYQPARQDTTVPVEDLVGAIADQVQAGYVKHIGLSMVDAETLRRACKVHLFNHLSDDRWQTVIQLFISIVENEACEKDKYILYTAIFNLGFVMAFRHSDIQSIHIPGSIKSLPRFMFYNCKRLETVVVEEGVEEVSISTFDDCLQLTELKIPKTVVSLFYKHPHVRGIELGLPNLKRIYLPSHLQYVMKGDDRVVVYDEGISTPLDTTEIADHAFRLLCVFSLWKSDRLQSVPHM